MRIDNILYPSKTHIFHQYHQLMNRQSRHFINNSPIITAYKTKKKYLCQETIIFNVRSPEYFRIEILTQVIQDALEDLIRIFELKTNIFEIEFVITHTYYVILKNEQLNTYSIFFCHGNVDTPQLLSDHIYYIKGTLNLEEYLETIIAMDHISHATQIFNDEFKDSNIIIDSITHIIFLIQPKILETNVQKSIFWFSN